MSTASTTPYTVFKKGIIESQVYLNTTFEEMKNSFLSQYVSTWTSISAVAVIQPNSFHFVKI